MVKWPHSLACDVGEREPFELSPVTQSHTTHISRSPIENNTLCGGTTIILHICRYVYIICILTMLRTQSCIREREGGRKI